MSQPLRFSHGVVPLTDARVRYAVYLAPPRALQDGGPPLADAVLAAGADRAGAPEGLALGQVRPGTRLGDVLSLWVADEARGQGIAKALLGHLERALHAQGATHLQATYRDDWPHAGAVLRVLDAAGWEPPRPAQYLFTTDLSRFFGAGWTDPDIAPDGYRLEPWDTAGQDDLDAVRRILHDDPRARPVSALQMPDRVDPLRSAWLRHESQIIGWLVVHRLRDEVVQYTGLYVAPEHRRSGSGVALVARAIRSVREHAPPSGSRDAVVFAVAAENQPMITFLQARKGLDRSPLATVWVAGKTLDPQAQPGPASRDSAPVRRP